ncbi:MAG: ATP-binding protein [Acidimicrobiales bacterium]
MTGPVQDVATVVAALARAAGNALDPSSILTRTMDVLAPVIDLGRAELWCPGPSGEVLAGSYFLAGPSPTEPVQRAVGGSGVITVALAARDRPLGNLVAEPAAGAAFSAGDEALLELAAIQISGALEQAQLYAQIMELERLKSDFIARVSHELRTPITIITGFLETLIAHEQTIDAEQRRHMLERSRTASARLADLIEELLILSRIEAGVLTPQPEALDATAVLETVRAAAAEPEQVFVEHPAGQQLVTDRALLTRALGLLVDNAVKYGGAAELSSRIDGERWVVEVRDRGPGFPDDLRDTAFELFTRSKSNSSVPGLGVGLAIARTLVEILDGTIAIESPATGPGALVRVSIPH